MEKMLFILNPVAGKLLGRTTLFAMLNVFNKAGYLVTVAITQREGHGRELAAAAQKDAYDIVVCCGGDGTLNEVINGLLSSGSDLPLGYIPTGSTNDFAKTLVLPPHPARVARLITRKRPHVIDVGCFNEERFFTYVASFGAFTSASYSVSQGVKNTLGHLAYIFEGIRDLATIKPHRVRIQTDTDTYEDDYVFASITNSTSLAGVVRLDPDLVDLKDGLFEVILVRMPRTPLDLNWIINGITNSDFSGPVFQFFRANQLEFHLNEPTTWSLDGERMDAGKHLHIYNLPRALTIYA